MEILTIILYVAIGIVSYSINKAEHETKSSKNKNILISVQIVFLFFVLLSVLVSLFILKDNSSNQLSGIALNMFLAYIFGDMINSIVNCFKYFQKYLKRVKQKDI